MLTDLGATADLGGANAVVEAARAATRTRRSMNVGVSVKRVGEVVDGALT